MPLLLCKLERIVVAFTKSRECTKTQACIQWPKKLQKLETVKQFNKAEITFEATECTQLSLKSLELIVTIFTCTDNRKIPSISYRETFFIIRVNIKLNLLHAFLNLQRSFYAVVKLKKMCIDKEIQKYFSAFAFGPEKFCLLCCDTWWNVLRMMRLIWRILRSKPYTEMWGGGSC